MKIKENGSPKFQDPNPKAEPRESHGLTSLESKDLEFETWNMGLGICNQNVIIYPVCSIKAGNVFIYILPIVKW